MIKYELIENDNRIHHYSDTGFKLLQNETGLIYDDAIDVIPCKYTYSETDELVEIEDIEQLNEQASI
jgi:hypothetical protein